MAFLYHGKVERLKDEVAKTRDAINQKYREILGEQRYDILSDLSMRLLTTECFFDSPEEYKNYFGQDMPSRTPSKLLTVTDAHPNLFPNGRIKDLRARVAFGFYVSEDTFRHSGAAQFTDRLIATYIHEFNHFTTFALQKTPVYLVELYMSRNVGMVRTPQDVQRLAAKLSMDRKTSREEKRNTIYLALNAFALNDIWEKSNQVFDSMVLESIDIKRDLPWRGEERQLGMCIMNDPHIGLAIPVAGDPFRGLEDKEVVRRFIEWEKYSNPSFARVPYVDNFMKSLETLQVDLMPLGELMKLN